MQFLNSKTGATTSAYVAAATLEQSMGAAVLVKNTHVSATMYYKILIYLANTSNAIEYEFVAETGLAAATASSIIIITFPFSKATISVKQNSGAGTYQVDAVTF